MKKFFGGLGMLLMCILIVGCGKYKDGSDIQSLLKQNQEFTQQMIRNGADWSVEDWKSHMKEVDKLSLKFWESNPSAEEVEEFDKQTKEYSDGLDVIWDDVRLTLRTARYQLDDDEDFIRVRKAIKKTAKDVRNSLK